ncbi:MAG: 2-hydroxychromene-2-carboxylate isomerase [Myxococcota bacterium]
MVASRSLRFYFDFISPYAYIGWHRFKGLAKRHELELEPVPVLFAVFLNTFGQKGPAEIEPKRLYTFKHVMRLGYEFGLPLLPPPAHPFNPLLALRVAEAAEPEQKADVLDILFHCTWGSGEGVTEPEAVAAALESAGLPGKALVVAAGTSPVKERLRINTEQAMARGVFGVPSIEIDGEVFWGQDSFYHVDCFIHGDDPLHPQLIERFEKLPAGSVRKPPAR